MRPLRSLPIRKLNKLRKEAVKVNAARVTPVPLARPALQVSMDAMVSMDSQANPGIVERQLPMDPSAKEPVKNNAHALLPQATVARKDPVVATDPLAMQVLQVPTVNQAVLDQPDHPAQLAIQEMQALQAQQANQAKPQDRIQAHQVQPAPTANPVLQARPVNPAELAKMAAPAVQVLPETLVLQAVLAKLAVPAVQAIQAKLALQAVANIAHPLVWLQVIKRRSQALFSGNTEYRRMSIYPKRPSVSIDFFPKCISASCVFTSQF